MAGNLQPITVKQALITIEGITAYFTKVSAPKEKREDVSYNDGQRGQTFKVTGFVELENITLSKSFDPVQDKALVAWYKARKNTLDQAFSVTVQPVTADVQSTPITGGGTFVLSGCKVVSFKYPEFDRLGSGLAMLEIEIAPESVTYQ